MQKRSRYTSPASSWKTCDYVVFEALNNWSQVSPLILDQSTSQETSRINHSAYRLLGQLFSTMKLCCMTSNSVGLNKRYSLYWQSYVIEDSIWWSGPFRVHPPLTNGARLRISIQRHLQLQGCTIRTLTKLGLARTITSLFMMYPSLPPLRVAKCFMVTRWECFN